MKIVKRIIYILILIIGIVAIYFGFDYVISNDVPTLSRVSLHDFYAEKNVDYLFIGPSHTLHSIDAKRLSDKFDKDVFNLATVDQDFLGSYYLLKDAIDHKDIEHVFMEFSISRLEIEEVDETRLYIITDYIKSPLYRAQMIFDSLNSDKYIIGLFRLRRNIDPLNLPSIAVMKTVYDLKQTDEYKNYLGNGEYLGKGQWATDDDFFEYNNTLAFYTDSMDFTDFEVDEIQQKELDYLIKIIELCKKNNIELTLYAPPYTEEYFMKFNDYEEVMKEIYGLADKYDVELIDMNLVKDEYMPLELSDYYRMDHLRSQSSDIVSDFIYEYVTNPSDKYFHNSISEKYPAREGVVSVEYNRTELDDGKIQLDVWANGYEKIKSKARVWEVKEENDNYIPLDEISSIKNDGYITSYVFDGFDDDKYYKVELCDIDSGEVLYDAITTFNMK